MKKILVVIDMQNDFIDGALGTAEAVGIVDKVVKKNPELSCGLYLCHQGYPWGRLPGNLGGQISSRKTLYKRHNGMGNPQRSGADNAPGISNR